MNNKFHDLLNPASYALSQEECEDLCTVRDQLLLMAQLVGTAACVGDDNTLLIILRVLFGRLFRDLSFQICDVADDMVHATTYEDRAQAH